MVTGVEAAGLALALLPLLLNQLDSYVQGLHTLKSFRTNKYRRHIESCNAMLDGQRAVLKNTIGLAFGDTVQEHVLHDVINQSDGTPSNNPILDDILRTRMGHSYDAFTAVMSEASKLLRELSNRLKLEAENPSVVGIDAACFDHRTAN